jgi:Ca-activated chloride channel family protein
MVLVTWLASSPLADGPDIQQPAFRTSIELVIIRVNVSDQQGRPLSDLTKEDFLVLENGRPQQLSNFLNANEPLDVALLLDVSSSMGPLLPRLRESAWEFLDGMGPVDRGMVVEFDRRIRILSDLTGDRSKLRQAVNDLHKAGSTSLYDGLYIIIKTLASRSKQFSRRQAVIALSDGQDTSSIAGAEDVFKASIRHAVPIYTILFEQPVSEEVAHVLSYEASSKLFTVQSLARNTGGRSFQIKDAGSLKQAYDQIARDLGQQYLLAYVSSAAAASRSPLHVAVRIPSRPSATVRIHLGHQSRSPQGP